MFLYVEMRQIRIKGYTAEAEERTYNMFIRNNPSLCRPYPVWMTIQDAIAMEVRFIVVDVAKLEGVRRNTYSALPCVTSLLLSFLGLLRLLLQLTS